MPRILAIGIASVDIINQGTEYPAEPAEVCARLRTLETACRLTGCKCAQAGFAGLENA